MKIKRLLLAFTFPVVMIGAVVACNVAKDVQAGADLILCIDTTYQDNPGMTPEQIAVKCGVQLTPEIISLINARKALAEKRKAACVNVTVAGYDAGPGVGK
jgi:hypothetical protein